MESESSPYKGADMYEYLGTFTFLEDKVVSMNVEADIYSKDEIIEHARQYDYKISIIEDTILLSSTTKSGYTSIKLFKRMGEQK